ncbi:MAG TPA: nuclear transport factor 2 family protein [Anaerolineae bacterium]|nr:nuclear transport factor 2 family protein [Anaerolineae bacterium]
MDPMNISLTNVEVVRRFTDALNLADLEMMGALISDDTVFENTYPAPDGTRYEGKPAVLGFWREFFQSSAYANIEIVDVFSVDDRCAMQWTYRWRDKQGVEGHIRGVDIYKLRDGLITEKLSYVKG